MYHMWDIGWFPFLGGIWMLVFWGAIIGLIIWGVKKLAGRPDGGSGAGNKPLDIARERYARGEITDDEFAQIKKNLGSY